MKKILFLFAIILLQQKALEAQDSIKLYLGLYTSGTVEQYSKYVTVPYYKNLNYYTISFIPKVGVQLKHITTGLIGGYTFHENTFQSLESLWGGGYFLKYNWLKKQKKRQIKFDYFLEWQHLVQDGYYVPVANWRRIKIKTPTTYLSLEAGLDIKFYKAFSIALSAGLGSSNLLSNPMDSHSDKPIKIIFSQTLTLQYHLKL